MKHKSIFKWVGVPVLVVVGLLLSGWLAFVPWAKEPGYEFVAAWGGPVAVVQGSKMQATVGL